MGRCKIILGLFDGRRQYNITLPADRVVVPRVRKRFPVLQDLGAELCAKLACPIGVPSLRELVKAGDRVTIIADDYTRPTPTDILLPPLLDELNRLGVADGNITLLVAAGFHREMTDGEKKKKYGNEACRRVRILHHFAGNRDNLVLLGSTSGGIPVRVNKLAVECDFSIGIGVIEVHPWAGFAGGGKIIFPGVAGKETIDATHMLPHEPNVEIGHTEGNPFWETCVEAARMAGLGMVVNTVMNTEGKVIALAVGEHQKAQLWGIQLFRKAGELIFPQRVDIVLTSAYPKFQQWGQAAISLYNAAQIVAEGGVRIVVADCPEGLGDSPQEKAFYLASLEREHDSPEKYWQNWLGPDGCHSRNTCAIHRHLKHLSHSRAVIVTNNLPENLYNQPVARNLDELLRGELARYGTQSKIAVYSHGALCLVTADAQAYRKASNPMQTPLAISSE